MNIERTQEFILKQQARFESNFAKADERFLKAEKRLDRLERVVGQTARVVGQLASASLRFCNEVALANRSGPPAQGAAGTQLRDRGQAQRSD